MPKSTLNIKPNNPQPLALKPIFNAVEAQFIHALNSFAANDFQFNEDYSLYKQSQQEAFQAYVDGLASGHTHGYIELPTGVGKTALFIALIKNYLAAAGSRENAPRVLIAVPTEKLAVQTAKSFAKFMPEIAPTMETDGDEGQEIDWKNSAVGLQYGKVKHAHKKPKVLITTYQSLSRDTVNKVYPPEDYGFVIYDEGHVITAPNLGKAVDKFKASIQLAVTATPEYTETKTVASRLPHRYFQLPLAEAINRGDLSNVRPAILKTGYTIDQALFQSLMEKQEGTPLNNGQLQLLLNQEARNKAVIETYFRGYDPDSGERYFGNNGMVFCTAVAHADAIAEQFRKALQYNEGPKLARWLDDEGLELIAAVHGKAKGSWLRQGMLPHIPSEKRQYQSGREWYSEEEIFDLHERGKILLLSSVAKLKWGYDSPRDSLLFDLADRFSKLDATQINGRAFRLDPENPDKTATVFNLMDENTQELYDKYPKLIPIYCSEVIEGAQLRPPASRSGAHVRFKQPPPGMEISLREAGFDVLTNITAVRTISRNNKAKRDEALRSKRDDFILLTPKHLAALEAEITRTGKGSYLLIKHLADQCPKGLSVGMIESWRGEKVISADPNHWNAVMAAYERLPVKQVTKMDLTADHLNLLEAEIKRTGKGVTALTTYMGDQCPNGLYGAIIERWRIKKIKAVKPDHWNAVMAAYERLPAKQVTKMDIIADHLNLLEAEIKRTSKRATAIITYMGDQCPKGLYAATIESWRTKKTKTVNPDHWNAVIAAYANLVKCDRQQTDRLRTYMRQTALDVRAAFTAADIPIPQSLANKDALRGIFGSNAVIDKNDLKLIENAYQTVLSKQKSPKPS